MSALGTNTFNSPWYDIVAVLLFCLLTLSFLALLQLKELFPNFSPALPPKRWFKDNYDEEFLEERQIGLQTFLQNLTSHKDVISRCVSWWYKVWLLQRWRATLFDLEFWISLLLSEAVRRFLCLIDPPSPFDSLEESRVRSFSSQNYCLKGWMSRLLFSNLLTVLSTGFLWDSGGD